MSNRIKNLFDLTGRVAIITGGAGLLGTKHAQIIAEAGGIPVLLDIPVAKPDRRAHAIANEFGVECLGIEADITNLESVESALRVVLDHFGRVNVLINNAANNPKMETAGGLDFSRLENFPIAIWEDDIRVGLLGAFLCSRVFGTEMARRGRGVIINIASDLALIGPDQRLYRNEDLPEDQQPVKPVTYSVVKSGLIGLTRYLATYWANAGVRANAISPGGVENGQSSGFIDRLARLIPMGRMADIDEYQGAILFLCSDASSYMTGSNLVIDGGRTTW